MLLISGLDYHLPAPITSTAGKTRHGPALSGVAAVEMMSGLIRPVSLDDLKNL